MNNLAIVVYSCDKNEEVWPAFRTCLNKYWVDHPVVYLLTETISYPYFNTICYDYDLGYWTKRIRASLKDVKEDKIIFICDDCFLDKEVNLKKLSKCLQILDDGYSNIQFELYSDPNDIDSVYPGFREKTEKSEYRISLLCGLWKKDRLIDILSEDCDLWTIEDRQEYDKTHRFLQISEEKVISWFNDQYGGNGAIRKGKWQHCVKDFFIKEGINMDFSKKGFGD